MAQYITNPYYDYVPQLGKNVWIKREVKESPVELVDGAHREMVWAFLYWSDNETGPWTHLTTVPHSFLGVSGI